MHTVERLDEALAIAKKLGFSVRQEWLGGSSGGGCEIKGQKWIFLDLALSPREHLDQVLEAIRGVPSAAAIATPSNLPSLHKRREAA